jgi:hypothetical protein
MREAAAALPLAMIVMAFTHGAERAINSKASLLVASAP